MENGRCDAVSKFDTPFHKISGMGVTLECHTLSGQRLQHFPGALVYCVHFFRKVFLWDSFVRKCAGNKHGSSDYCMSNRCTITDVIPRPKLEPATHTHTQTWRAKSWTRGQSDQEDEEWARPFQYDVSVFVACRICQTLVVFCNHVP